MSDGDAVKNDKVLVGDWTVEALATIARRRAGWRGLEVFEGTRQEARISLEREGLSVESWRGWKPGHQVGQLTRVLCKPSRQSTHGVAYVVGAVAELGPRLMVRGPVASVEALLRGLSF